jgi:hypothetical protein
MPSRRTRKAFRVDEVTLNILAAWKEDNQNKSVYRNIEKAVRSLLRDWIQGALTTQEIKNLAKLSQPLDRWYRVDLDPQLHTHTTMLLRDSGLSMSALMRASIKLLPQLDKRERLEEEYVEHGGIGRPEYMSDSFLQLWVKYKGFGPATDGVRIVRTLHAHEQRLTAIEKKLDTLDQLFEQYGIEGILKSEKPPRKQDILALEGRGLRAMCTRWKISVSSQFSDDMIRRRLLSEFGYQQEI